MKFDIIPSQEIPEMLAAHIRGPYRFVQRDRIPYVRVGPATETEPITIKSSDRIQLLKSRSVHLTGLESTIDFTIIYDDDFEMHLVQTPFHAEQLDPHDGHARLMKDRATVLPRRSIHLGAPVWEHSVEGGGTLEQSESVAPEPEKASRIKPPKQLKVSPIQGPSVDDSPVCDALRDLVVREKIDPALGDYLFIPAEQAQQYAPLPRWAAATKLVKEIHVVKPRLGTDTPIQSTGDFHGK